MSIKGVPEELQIAYNQNPEQFDLLGVMADAADDAGEYEVAEALRWLWRWKRVPDLDKGSGRGSGWAWPPTDIMGSRVEAEFDLPLHLRDFCPMYAVGDSALRAIERVTIGFPKWKAQHSEEYQRFSVPPSILTPQTTPS